MMFYKKIINYYRRAYGMGHFPSFFSIIFSRKRILIYYGFLGDGNFGDELVYMATKSLFEKDLLIPYKRHMPILTKAILNLNPTMIDGVVIGGGTLLRPFYSDKKFFSKIAQLKGRMFFHGTGTDDEIVGNDFWQTLNHLKFYGGVRGPLSQQVSHKYQFDFDAIGDAAFYLFKDNDLLKNRTSSKVVLINYGTHVVLKDLENSRREIEQFLSFYSKKGFTINYLPFHNTDIKLGEDLISKYPFINMLKIPQNYNEALAYFNDAEFAIGERLHFSVMCAMANTPFVSINYGYKHNDFLQSIKGASFGLKPQEVKMDQLITFYENKDTLYNWNDINEILLKFRKKHETQRILFQDNLK